MQKGRVSTGGKYFPKGPDGAKEILHALKNGQHLAMLVDQKMNEVQRSVPSSMNASKIAILAAMNISDELFGARRGEYSFKGEVESKVKSLIERIEEITD